MIHTKRRFDKATIIALLVLAAFCVSMIPVLYASFYTHPVADDYSFSFRVHQALLNGTGILRAVIETVAESYTGWQGTFSAVAIFALQPGVYSSSSYFLTTFVMVGALTASTLFLSDTVIRKLLHGKKSHVVILSCLTLLMNIQFVPNACEAFFWFNGSSYYTLFYSFALVYVALLLRFSITKHQIVFIILILILGTVIGGGNYTTALIVAEISVLITLSAFFRKSSKKWWYLIFLLVYLAAFFLNAAAPGNHVRAEAVTGLSPIMAIAQSIYYALEFIGEWTTLPQFVYTVSVSVLSVFLVPKCSAKFRFPIIAVGVAFLLFASQLTPSLYAMSNVGSGRQIDIYYYSYGLLVAFSVFYLCGWTYQRLVEQDGSEAPRRTIGLAGLIHQHLGIISIVLCLFFAVGCYAPGLLKMTSAQTAKAIVDGSLVQYDREYREMLRKLDSGSGDIMVEDIRTVPPFLSNLGLSEDTDYWINKAVARYFEVDSVKALSNDSLE